MTKRNKIVYWISTVWLALGMLSTGIVQFRCYLFSLCKRGWCHGFFWTGIITDPDGGILVFQTGRQKADSHKHGYC